MKRLLPLLLTLALVWIGVTSATPEGDSRPDGPSIVFKAKSYDFGNIKEADGKVTTEFTFTNKGNAPLVILSATAGCGCTQPSFPEEPVQPGKSASVRVTYNPKGRPGEFSKNVTVKTNDRHNKKVVLRITGTVLPEAK